MKISSDHSREKLSLPAAAVKTYNQTLLDVTVSQANLTANRGAQFFDSDWRCVKQDMLHMTRFTQIKYLSCIRNSCHWVWGMINTVCIAAQWIHLTSISEFTAQF